MGQGGGEVTLLEMKKPTIISKVRRVETGPHIRTVHACRRMIAHYYR